jgi:hypothetical protein
MELPLVFLAVPDPTQFLRNINTNCHIATTISPYFGSFLVDNGTSCYYYYYLPALCNPVTTMMKKMIIATSMITGVAEGMRMISRWRRRSELQLC